MWNPFKPASKLRKDVSAPTAIAIILATIALFTAYGSWRSSWVLLDEQLRLRKDFSALRNDQVQTGIQYEYWLGKLKAERVAATSATPTTPVPAAKK